MSVTRVIQDASQLVLHYGERRANVILSMVGKIMQDRESLAINSSDTSSNKSKQPDYAIPQSTIAALSAGEVVGG